jgi:hypothetical protein
MRIIAKAKTIQKGQVKFPLLLFSFFTFLLVVYDRAECNFFFFKRMMNIINQNNQLAPQLPKKEKKIMILLI